MSYVVLSVEGASGQSYKALGPEDAVGLPPEGPDSSGLVAVRLYREWTYLSGHGPAVRRAGLGAYCPSTRMVMHTIVNGAGAVERVRMILLEGTRMDVNHEAARDTRELTAPDTYVDAWLAADGSLDHFGAVASFDRNATEGSSGLMDEIDAARAEHGVA